MNIIELIKEELDNLNKNYTTVYRGQNNKVSTNLQSNAIWVTPDYNYAKLYGNVVKYKMPTNLNILDATYNESIWNELCAEFENEDYEYDYEDYKFNPSNELIQFLQSKGYDGFQHETGSGDNILLFDKSKLI
jgi:hypothetical protein